MWPHAQECREEPSPFHACSAVITHIKMGKVTHAASSIEPDEQPRAKKPRGKPRGRPVLPRGAQSVHPGPGGDGVEPSVPPEEPEEPEDVFYECTDTFDAQENEVWLSFPWPLLL